jgi:diguanylate cyclase (GGDEF)-like protein/PAS domain S-box-containing protein
MKEKNQINHNLKNIFESLIENNVISLFLLNEIGIIQNFNENASLQVGFDLADYKNRSFHLLFDKEHQTSVKKQFNNFLNGNFEKNVVELNEINHKKTKLQLSFSNAEFNGVSYGIYGLLSQVDEEEMPSYNNVVNDVINELDVSIWAADYRTKKYLHVSHGSEKVYGYTSEQFYNDPILWAKVIYPEDLPKVELGQKELRKGKAIDNEYRIIHSSGDIRWISDKVIPKLDTEGKIIQYMGIIKDITDQKNAEQLLAESEQKFRSLYEYNPFSVYTLNTEGNFIDGNTASEAMIGYRKEDLIGNSFLPLMAENSKPKALHFFQEVLKGEAQNYVVDAVHKNGSYIKLNITNIPVKVNGQIIGVHGIAKDLSSLQESEEKYRNLVEQSLVGVYIIQDGKFVYTNQTLLKIFGYESVIGKPSIEVIHEGDRERIAENMQRRLIGEIVPTTEAKALKADGTVFHIELLGTKTTYNGKAAVTGMLLDITQRKVMEGTLTEREQQLIAKEERFKSLIQYSADIVKVLDSKGEITYIGPTVENLTEKSIYDYIGKSHFEFVHKDDVMVAKQNFQEVINSVNTPIKFELRVMLTSNRYYHCEVTAVNRLKDPSVNGIVYNYKDITEQKYAQQKIHHLAYHDDLTGLPNRRYLLENLKEYISQSNEDNEQFSIFFFDIDGFKFINDSLGHFAGDELLIQVSERLLEAISQYGFVARNGGDEFTVVIKNSTVESTEHYAKKILNIFKKPFTLNNYDFIVTVSIGVAVFPEAGESVQTLLKNADIAMYQAKEDGKNQYKIYTTSMEQVAIKTFTLRNDLRKALQNREFSIHYQPRIDVGTNDIIGAEALLRWKHPEFGFVSPTEFIPLAEETGLIIPISNWVLEEVCNHHKQWVENGLNKIKVSVNFSALQFLQKDLLKTIIDIFTRTKMDPNFLEIEITESVVMEHKDTVLATIEKMKAMGIRIAIDDFGTGYSSISYLKKFKIDTLKIDRSFIKSIPTDADSVELTNATIQLAQSLGLGIVGEGVETLEQFMTLKDSGCQEVQGFLFSKPVPEKDFQRMLNKIVCLPQTQR